MTRRPNTPSEVRRRAEKRLRAKGAPPETSHDEDRGRLLHELQVHQVELELQNEELQTAREELEVALRRYTELFDFAPIGYATLSIDGRIREVNHVGARLLGRERALLIGSSFGSGMGARATSQLEALFARAREGEANASCELELAFAAEGTVSARFTATALARGAPQILLAFEDITERKAQEQQLARTEQALRDADRRKDEFLAMLSHELRNPLAPIHNSLFVLDHVPPGSENARAARAIIDRQIAHLTRLVGDLLDVTRITRGKVELQLERVELGELMRSTMDDHLAGFQAYGIRLESHFEPGPYWLEADPARLVQILSNVLGNAEKFTPRDGQVVVTLRRRASRIVLSIRDTGIGITADVLDGLFEPFAQAPQALDRGRGGLGLGLAMVKGLVALHGGTVALRSEGSGRGTEVEIELPAVSPPASGASS